MKENLMAIAIFIGFFMAFFSIIIIPVTLINEYLIYWSIPIVGFLVSIIYIKYNKNKILEIKEYVYIPIRATLSLGCIITFSFLYVNYWFRSSKVEIVKVPVKTYFLDKELRGTRYSRKIVIKSAFRINYKGQSKDIIWNSRLEDSIMLSVKAIEIKKSNGLLGIDIIEDTDLLY